MDNVTRRRFMAHAGMAAALSGIGQAVVSAADVPKDAQGNVIPGFENPQGAAAANGWQPFSDRKIRVGIAGFGLCQFGAQFECQNHPNVEVVAVTDLVPAQCAALAQACRCEKTYPSCEEMLKDDRIMGGLRNTLTPAQVDPERYRAVYYVGGSNAMYGVAENPTLQRIAMHVYERNGGVVSAVCHGTAGLVNLTLANGQHLISGKRISGYPEEHEDKDAPYLKEFPFLIRKTVEARGGLFHAINSYDPYIEVDGRVVTGQNYASATPVAQAVVEVLRTLANQPATRGATTR